MQNSTKKIFFLCIAVVLLIINIGAAAMLESKASIVRAQDVAGGTLVAPLHLSMGADFWQWLVVGAFFWNCSSDLFPFQQVHFSCAPVLF